MATTLSTVVVITTETIAQGFVLKVHMPATIHVHVNHGGKLEKFNRLSLKRWQQKMFYLTSLNLVRFLSEEAPTLNEGETNMQVVNVINAWKHSNFLCKNYVMNGLHDSFCNVYCAFKTTKEL